MLRLALSSEQASDHDERNPIYWCWKTHKQTVPSLCAAPCCGLTHMWPQGRVALATQFDGGQSLSIVGVPVSTVPWLPYLGVKRSQLHQLLPAPPRGRAQRRRPSNAAGRARRKNDDGHHVGEHVYGGRAEAAPANVRREKGGRLGLHKIPKVVAEQTSFGSQDGKRACTQSRVAGARSQGVFLTHGESSAGSHTDRQRDWPRQLHSRQWPPRTNGSDEKSCSLQTACSCCFAASLPQQGAPRRRCCCCCGGCGAQA